MRAPLSQLPHPHPTPLDILHTLTPPFACPFSHPCVSFPFAHLPLQSRLTVVKAEAGDLQSEIDRITGTLSDARGRRDGLASALSSTEAEVERVKQRLGVVSGRHTICRW